MKRILFVILALLFLTSLYGCTSNSTGQLSSSSNVELESADNKLEDKTSDSSSVFEMPTIEETVVLDQEGIKVTALSLVNDPVNGLGMTMHIDNQTEDIISIQCYPLLVNHFDVNASYDFFHPTIAPKSSAEGTVYFWFDSLKALGIQTLSDIEVGFSVNTMESVGNSAMVYGHSLFDSELTEIHTSLYGQEEQLQFDNWVTVVDKDDVQVRVTWYEGDDYWGKGLLMYFYNQSDTYMIATGLDCYVNGEEAYLQMQYAIDPGAMALSSGRIMSLLEGGVPGSDIEDDLVKELSLSIRLVKSSRIIAEDPQEILLETELFSIPVQHK